MNKKITFFVTALFLLAVTGCQTNNNTNTSGGNSDDSSFEWESGTYFPSIDIPAEINIDEPVNTGDFSLTTSTGNFTQSGNIYTITKAGTYTAKGVLNGQILVQAGEDDDIELDLEGATISYDQDSPIKALTGNSFDVSAKSGTANLVKDLRANKVVENDAVGEGAINAKVDLKIKGNGTLYVIGNFNNGIHTSDDLKIQNLSLKVIAYNNALKGNDSITINSGTIYAISQTGQGIKTKNSDLSSKNKQRGSITILGGNIQVDSAQDAIEASYDVVIGQANVATEPSLSLTLKTGKNSINKAKYDSTKSSKGLKAENKIDIHYGTVIVAASDDAVHANYGTALENGTNGIGNINITGGALSVASGDDGLHADNTLAISGGTVIITNAKEGLEANHIKISGGATYVYGSDDGVNASKKINETPTVEVTGGLLDVAVSNGDTDGIDSNGNFSQTGGVVISRGSPGTNPSNMSTGLDCDGTASINGGTFIAFNGMEKTPSSGSGVLNAKTANASGQGGRPGGGGGGGDRPGPRANEDYIALTATSFSAGHYTLSGEGINISFLNNYQYATFIVYSASLSLNKEYSLLYEGNAVLNWKQSATSTTIS